MSFRILIALLSGLLFSSAASALCTYTDGKNNCRGIVRDIVLDRNGAFARVRLYDTNSGVLQCSLTSDFWRFEKSNANYDAHFALALTSAATNVSLEIETATGNDNQTPCVVDTVRLLNQ